MGAMMVKEGQLRKWHSCGEHFLVVQVIKDKMKEWMDRVIYVEGDRIASDSLSWVEQRSELVSDC
jgi:hypothetical protein